MFFSFKVSEFRLLGQIPYFLTYASICKVYKRPQTKCWGASTLVVLNLFEHSRKYAYPYSCCSGPWAILWRQQCHLSHPSEVRVIVTWSGQARVYSLLTERKWQGRNAQLLLLTRYHTNNFFYPEKKCVCVCMCVCVEVEALVEEKLRSLLQWESHHRYLRSDKWWSLLFLIMRHSPAFLTH